MLGLPRLESGYINNAKKGGSMTEGKCKSCFVCKLIGLLVIVGALNWGAVGFFQFNVVDHFLGVGTTITRVIYDLVGVAGLLKLITCFKPCPCTKKV